MKIKFLAFTISAVLAGFMISGCGDEETVAPSIYSAPDDSTSLNTTYKGQHTVLVFTIADTIELINANVGDKRLEITSTALGQSIWGTIDANDPFKVILDSVFQESLAIGQVEANNIRAGGTGTLSKDYKTIKTSIKIKQGTAKVNGSPISIAGQELKGSFNK